ncbi:MAG: DNRLRE domain-containing protein [Bacteroidales bacterium]|nr:DNRLRE domain-containing protein [Bacteroidales bacterium]
MRSLTLILLVVFAFSSCEKNSDTSKGTAKFSIATIEQSSQLKSAWADTDLVSYHLLVSVEDSDGSPVLTDHLVPVYLFGPGYISEELEMIGGDYHLTKFMLIDPSGTVIAATPVEGSPLAYLVNDPLPLEFSISGGTATIVSPELLAVGSHTPGDFGYISFGGQIIKPLDFYAVCIIDNPLSMAPMPQRVTADLTVYAGNDWRYRFRLEASVNHLIIRGGYEYYTFLLEKDGYLPQKFVFTARELKATTEISPLFLKIPYDSGQWKILVLQPGPDVGKDAMISNLEPGKNFGEHRYFEATFISEPILTVMRSNESLISFDMNALPKSATIRKVDLNLWYDLPLVWDSTIFYPAGGGDIQWSGGVLQKIIEPWEEDKVTWNEQPKTTEAFQIYLSPFILNTNMITVDVTKLYVQDPATDAPDIPGYGMFFRLWPGEWVRGFRFASSDYPEARMRPMLTIYYTLPQ